MFKYIYNMNTDFSKIILQLIILQSECLTAHFNAVIPCVAMRLKCL